MKHYSTFKIFLRSKGVENVSFSGKVLNEVKIVFILRRYSGFVIPQAIRDFTQIWNELGTPTCV